MLITSVALLECSCGPRCAGSSGEGVEPWGPGKSQGYTLSTPFCQVLGPLIGIQVPEEKVERNRKSMVGALQRLEEKFLGDRAFLVGQQVTLADLMCLEELIQV